jgi:hypothetical protein
MSMKKRKTVGNASHMAPIAAAFVGLFVIIFVLLAALLLAACDGTDLTLQTDFDFEVEMLPVPPTVTLNEAVEMRFELTHVGGRYDSTAYYVRYFQYEGKGTLADEGGIAFVPNDAYRLTKENFRLYFTATKGDNHTLELVFFDSFKHRHQVDLNFGVEEVVE